MAMGTAAAQAIPQAVRNRSKNPGPPPVFTYVMKALMIVDIIVPMIKPVTIRSFNILRRPFLAPPQRHPIEFVLSCLAFTPFTSRALRVISSHSQFCFRPASAPQPAIAG